MRQQKSGKEQATRAFLYFVLILYGPTILGGMIASPFVAAWRFISKPFRKP
jgi:hypothetical protein